jgi:hypothetical protein
MNYEMLDHPRIQLAWLLEYCDKYNIPLPDLDKAQLFKTSGHTLEQNSPTESWRRVLLIFRSVSRYIFAVRRYIYTKI